MGSVRFAADRGCQRLLVDRHAEILAHLGDVLGDQVVAEAGAELVLDALASCVVVTSGGTVAA